jgi:hypothetical protein
VDFGRRFRPTRFLPFRTHVPRADHPSTEQALAPRAGARGRGNGHRVRDAGRGNSRPRGRSGSCTPAVPEAFRGVHRPHRRAPAPPTYLKSAHPAPGRLCTPPRSGLQDAGSSPGIQAGLTARRRPVWEDGAAGRTSSPLGPPAPRSGRPERWSRLARSARWRAPLRRRHPVRACRRPVRRAFVGGARFGRVLRAFRRRTAALRGSAECLRRGERGERHTDRSKSTGCDVCGAQRG